MSGVRAFPWTEQEFAERVRLAVVAYWQARARQARKQRRTGRIRDAGTRSSVTGGKHLDAFATLLLDVIDKAGLASVSVHFQKPLSLPGYYRAQKKWDIAVCRGSTLLAAIELKSQSGSFGNNLNNRVEEVVGLSKDFWTAYREQAFGVVAQPWLGYFFLLEDAEASRRVVRVEPSAFPPDAVFEGSSYQDRYRILCERLVLERDYAAAALLCAPKGASDGRHESPASHLSFHAFAQSLFRHLSAAG